MCNVKRFFFFSKYTFYRYVFSGTTCNIHVCIIYSVFLSLFYTEDKEGNPSEVLDGGWFVSR